MDFLYFGEANVFQDNLDAFLTIAEELRLKGLTGGLEAPGELSSVKDIVEPPKEYTGDKRVHTNQQRGHLKPVKKDSNLNQHSDGTLAVQNDYTISADLEQLNGHIASMMEPTDKIGRLGGKMVACKLCGKEGYKSEVASHIEAKHITGVSHSCDVCGKSIRSRDALRKHKSRNHHQQ